MKFPTRILTQLGHQNHHLVNQRPLRYIVRDRTDVLPAIQRVGGAPVVIKLLDCT